MTESMKKEQSKADTRCSIGYLDTCLWVAIFMVVFCHAMTAIARQYERYGLPENDANLYMAISRLTNWAVPAFVMIAGILYLNPEKDVNYRYLFRKPILRALLALLVFGYPMCIAESVLNHGFSQSVVSLLWTSFLAWISGNSWDHMWYLYMYIGLLMVVPLIRAFSLNASNRELICLMAVLFLFNSVIATANFIGIEIGFNMPIVSVYTLYFISGYYIEYRTDFSKIRIWHLLTASIALGTVVFLRQYLIPDIEVKYAEPIQVFYAISIFSLFKKLNIKNALLSRTRGLCFAIYLIHPIFINLFYKVLHITPANYGFPSPVVFAFVFFSLSVFAAKILELIPFVRNKIM